jgi:hypothetical protein
VTTLPDPRERQAHATQAGQPTPDTDQFWNAYDRAILEGRPYNIPTFHRDETKPPAYGPTPPVPQPGRPPMSQRATDASALMLSAGIASIPIGGMTSLVVYTLGQVDPTTLAIAAIAPASLALPILALCRLANRAKQAVEAAPPVIHHHYNGPVRVDARTVNSKNSGVWASTRNQLPAGE